MKSLQECAEVYKYKCIHSIGINVSYWSLSSDYHKDKAIRIYNSIVSMSGLRILEKLMLSAVSIDQKDWSDTLYRKANIIFNIRKCVTYVLPINMFRRSQ